MNCQEQEKQYMAYSSTKSLDGFECDMFEYKVWVWNLIGLLAITLWSGGICALMFYLLKIMGVLRYTTMAHNLGHKSRFSYHQYFFVINLFCAIFGIFKIQKNCDSLYINLFI